MSEHGQRIIARLEDFADATEACVEVVRLEDRITQLETECDTLRAQCVRLEGRVRELEAFEDMAWDLLWQECAEQDKDGNWFIDNRCMSDYEAACDVFEKRGKLKARNARIYDVVKEPAEAAPRRAWCGRW